MMRKLPKTSSKTRCPQAQAGGEAGGEATEPSQMQTEFNNIIQWTTEETGEENVEWVTAGKLLMLDPQKKMMVKRNSLGLSFKNKSLLKW